MFGGGVFNPISGRQLKSYMYLYKEILLNKCTLSLDLVDSALHHVDLQKL